MKRPPNKAPADADAAGAITPVICYPVDTLPMPDMAGSMKPHVKQWNRPMR